ncbi:hypothetical protein CEXT_189561 [Caerostris extrusa]|uniref:Secreted protein n=1 Tax=Caerostris extrusa TaxID=172846 RepID=A0AAV4WZ53_CAEEX|nr:hypothetical protein CEXT_189561 [Caerostris extrusa]
MGRPVLKWLLAATGSAILNPHNSVANCLCREVGSLPERVIVCSTPFEMLLLSGREVRTRRKDESLLTLSLLIPKGLLGTVAWVILGNPWQWERYACKNKIVSCE